MVKQQERDLILSFLVLNYSINNLFSTINLSHSLLIIIHIIQLIKKQDSN